MRTKDVFHYAANYSLIHLIADSVHRIHIELSFDQSRNRVSCYVPLPVFERGVSSEDCAILS